MGYLVHHHAEYECVGLAMRRSNLRIPTARLAYYSFRSNDLAPLIHLLVYDTLVTEGNVAVTP